MWSRAVRLVYSSRMPAPALALDLNHLIDEIEELHDDARDAARAGHLCEVAAGQRLLELRASMGASAWSKWIASGECPVLPATATAYVAAAEQYAGRARDAA
jgi:urease accessory protein UreF